MQVKLISYSQPPYRLSKIDCIQDLVCFCARVSNPGNQKNTDTNLKLLKYLIKNEHWSPFEMVSICIEIETTRDIARQILRHRSFSFQEFSQRYADPTSDLRFEARDARLQDETNRQNSLDNYDVELEEIWRNKQKSIIEAAEHTYLWARSQNIAREQARSVLPEGNTLSRLYMNGTLRSWIHYIKLRSGNGTQLEHQEIANECKLVISDIFPLIGELV
jgi:thymidylate synthase (FAD)